MTQTKQGTFKKNLLAAAVLGSAIAITGCSNDGAYVPGEAQGEVAGVAYDGYLDQAEVCLDVNQNAVCDSDEPSTFTGSGGVYYFLGLTRVQERLPIVLRATQGVTIDEDFGTPVRSSFTYLAPENSSTISAFSTIVQVERQRLIADGATPSQALINAKSIVGQALGAPDLDFTRFDAVAVSRSNSADSDRAERLHLVNQVVTRNLVRATEQAQSVDSNQANFAAVISAAVQKTADKLTETKQAVDAAVPAGITVPDLASSQLQELLDKVVSDANLAPEPVTPTDIAEAKTIVTEAQKKIQEAIEAETGDEVDEPQAPTGGTGGTGGSNDGGQGLG